MSQHSPLKKTLMVSDLYCHVKQHKRSQPCISDTNLYNGYCYPYPHQNINVREDEILHGSEAAL